MKYEKKFVVLISLIILVILFSLFVYLYNNVFMPFRGENKDILYNPIDYSIKCGEEFSEFYSEFLEYENYEGKYETKFYYCFGYKSLIRQYTLTFDKYGMESFSYVIKCEEDYDQVKENILTKYRFANIPILLSYETYDIIYESFVEINGTVYQEIHYDYFLGEYGYQRADNFPIVSYWFGYNDERKEIIFSLLFKYASSSQITKEKLFVLMENNLYS